MRGRVALQLAAHLHEEKVARDPLNHAEEPVSKSKLLPVRLLRFCEPSREATAVLSQSSEQGRAVAEVGDEGMVEG